jgi:hypothetical protein
MLQLLLTMITAYEKYENQLDFTKSDINNFFKKYIKSDEDLECNERGYMVLFRNKYITNEQFQKYINIRYHDNTFWLEFDSFNDILPSEYEYESSILDGTNDWHPSDFYEVDIESYWDYYTEKTLENMIEFCVKNELEIDNELMTKNNTKIINNEIYFNDVRLIENIDQIEELREILNNAVCEAQDIAYQDEVYDQIKKNFEESIGNFKFVTVKLDNKNIEKIHVEINNWDDIEQFLIDSYGEYDFEDEYYGYLFSILKEMDFFKFRKPNYDYIYGDIDKETLNEYTQDRLL